MALASQVELGEGLIRLSQVEVVGAVVWIGENQAVLFQTEFQALGTRGLVTSISSLVFSVLATRQNSLKAGAYLMLVQLKKKEKLVLGALENLEQPVDPDELVQQVRAHFTTIEEAEMAIEALIERGCIVLTTNWELAAAPNHSHAA